MPPWTAAPIACAALAIALWLNRNAVGFLPDDRPGGRKQHARPMPLAGALLGVGAAAILAVADAFVLAGAVLATTVLGFVDDWRKERGDGLPWQLKGVVLAAAAGTAVAVLPADRLDPGQLAALALGVFVITNAVNFLDNTDGVALGVGGLGLLLLGPGWPALPTIAWLFLGALPWNWPRPRLFLGDAGALSLGLLLGSGAAARLASDPAAAWPLALAAVAVPVLDFAQVVTARVVIGHPPWLGDRRHLTHIALHRLGVPRACIAPLFSALVGGAFLWARAIG
jgi:UDP-N-acetylmuramyl pentapeptide phosphotransferase/UDP-N-acetylglucosamine-1-phosphate transferase